MSSAHMTSRENRSWLSVWGAVLAVLGISLLATFLVWKYEEKRVKDVGQLQFERSSQILQDDILNTMHAYAQFLRGGVGFVHASGEVGRDEWRQFVADAHLGQNYPGIQGVSINGFLSSIEKRDAFLARVRGGDWPTFTIKPEGLREAYAPVLYLEPLSESNERAIGFDIYSEDLRRAAVDQAVVTGEPTMTAKITLVQEGDTTGQARVQAGILLILPTYEGGVEPESATGRRETASGLIVSVFRMGDLINSVYDLRGETPNQRIRLNLYDADQAIPEAQLFGDTYEDDTSNHEALFTRTATLDLYGRTWTFVMSSSAAFEKEVASASPKIVLGVGVLLSMLLTSLVLGQAQRALETEIAAQELSRNQRHIELLMGEVNHRSKNLLSLVQAIARQTKADDPNQFVSQFSERVRALAASQDLLVKNGWQGISLHELVDSQLAHFEGLLGNRIQLNGPDIDVNAEASQTLGMAFHELATNAGKYGALSNDAGTVDIEWRINSGQGEPGDQLEVAWLESGGPPVTVPHHKGFGTKVTELMVKYALDGKVESLFEPNGFKWRLICATQRVFEDPSDPIGTNLKSSETTL